MTTDSLLDPDQVQCLSVGPIKHLRMCVMKIEHVQVKSLHAG